MSATRKSALIELTSFKILFLVTFQVSALDESHRLLVKLPCKSACENLQCCQCKICTMLFSANIAVEQVILAAIVIAHFMFSYASIELNSFRICLTTRKARS